jgi:replication-associated recombination protein RarA
MGRSRLEKPLHKWLDGSDEVGRRLQYVLWGPGGVGKSTLALKFAAGRAAAVSGVEPGVAGGRRPARRPTTSWRGPGSGG